MPVPLLLVATASRWFGAARVPRALANAGFEVTLLAPRGSLAEQSAFVSKVGHLPDNATPMQWVFAFAASVRGTSPRFVVPCDDTALRLLQMLVLSPPEGMQAALQLQLASLIRDSLGHPAHYRTSIDKTLLPAAAGALGVPMPPYTIAGELGEAEAFARRHGYPVVLKRNHSSAGSGVAICADAGQLAREFGELRRGATQDFERSGTDRLLVQAHVSGPTKFYPAMAWKGTILVGYAGVRLVANPEPMGPPTVNRYYHSAELRAMTSKLAAGFGMTGFFSPEFVEDARTGRPYLLEINRRIVGGAHRGAAIKADHWAALHAALEGLPSPTRSDLDDGEEHVTVHFPQEWLRDPASRWLREYPVDVPWDEPKLIEALLSLRDEP
jgi:predicted ATP-grasp superfamily ATP-dependent carboligase